MNGWAEIVGSVEAVTREVLPIQWCTPLDVPRVTEQLIDDAKTGRPFRGLLDYSSLELEPLRARLAAARSKLSWADDPLTGELSRYVDGCLDTADVVSSRSDERFSAWSVRAYGRPDAESVTQARRLLGSSKVEAAEIAGCEPAGVDFDAAHSADLTPGEMAARIRLALNAYGLSLWRVSIGPNVAKMSVNAATRTVRIRQDIRFSEVQAARLVVHEVGGHVLRAENAHRQPEPAAALGLGDATPTEEGLALWLEKTCQVQSAAQLRVFAARTVAVDMAKTAGIVEITQHLVPHLGWNDAAAVALRAKRGLRDPNGPGGYTKDHAYLSGATAVQTHLRQQSEDVTVLYSTRWALDLLPMARVLIAEDRLRPPRYLPERVRLLGPGSSPAAAGCHP